MTRRPPSPPRFPSTTLFRSRRVLEPVVAAQLDRERFVPPEQLRPRREQRLEERLAEDAARHRLARVRDRRRLRRSEEHTSELQSRLQLVCRFLLEKKKYETN